MATKKQAKKLAQQLNIRLLKDFKKMNSFGGYKNGIDVLRYFSDDKKVKLYQTCLNCGDAHGIDLTSIANTL